VLLNQQTGIPVSYTLDTWYLAIIMESGYSTGSMKCLAIKEM